MITEVVIDGDIGIAGDLRALRTDLLEGPQVLDRELFVVAIIVGAQQHAAVGVECYPADDVGVRGDEIDHRVYLRLRRRIRPSAALLRFLPPVLGEVAIEVETLLFRLDCDRHAIVILDGAFGQQSVVIAAELRGIAAHHQARLLGAGLPRAVGIGDTHREHPPVTVDILRHQTADGILIVGIRPRAGADVAWLVRHRPLRAVGVHARADVECPRVEGVRDIRILTIARNQHVDEVEARGGRR